MSDEEPESTDEAASDRDEEVEAAHEDPDEIDEDGRYDDRHEEARETANPDDHRDEEPHRS